ncbi:hypothetical protein JCM10449v2_004550 [Rhodotorula kratochvilovae]
MRTPSSQQISHSIIVTVKLTAAGQPFPTQSKGTSAFTNAGAAGFEARRVGATVLALGLVAGGMMLA